ncbi:hypothetical protein PoB_002033000, partial [Plakobranchus ocellatus]
MYLRAACLIVALALVSAVEEVQDVHAMKVKAFEPGHENNPSDNLKMRCSINATKTNFVSLTKLKLYTSDINDGVNFEALGSITEDKVSYGLTRKEITVEGKYRLDTDYRTKLEITWATPDSGYCLIYKCVATGRDPNNGKLLAIYRTLQTHKRFLPDTSSNILFITQYSAIQMFLRAISLFVAVVLVSAADPIEDPFNAIKIKAFEPGHEDNPGNTLVMRCSIDIDRTNFVNLTKLKFYASDLSDGVNFDTLGSLTKDKITYGLTRKDISVSGKHQDGSEYRSKLEITWVSPDSGY